MLVEADTRLSEAVNLGQQEAAGQEEIRRYLMSPTPFHESDINGLHAPQHISVLH